MTANPLEAALAELVGVLDEKQVPYMVIGAIAGLAWGLRRATFDVDITLWPAEREVSLVKLLSTRFRSRVPDPPSFVSRTGVLPLAVGDTHADVVFGRLPYEQAAIRRAKTLRLGAIEIRVCTPEDLIVHKIISERAKDLEDVRGIVKLRGKELDRDYLDPLVLGMARDLERPDIRERYLAVWD